MSNAVRKCKIAQGEAGCYLLPDCIASAIKIRTTPLQINPVIAWLIAAVFGMNTCSAV